MIQKLKLSSLALGSMVKKELIIMTRYPVNFLVSFVTSFIMVSMYIFVTLMFAPQRSEGSLAGVGGVGMFGFFLSTFFSSTLWEMASGIRWEQYQGTLECLYLTPASKFSSLVSKVIPNFIWTGFNSLAMLLFAQALFGRLPFHNLGVAAYIFTMTIAGIFGFGFAFAAFTLLVKESAILTANFLQFSLYILCAMFFPFSALPTFLLGISRLIPLSYCIDAFRSTLMGYPPGFPELLPIEQELIIITAFGTVMPLLGYLLYKAAERKVRIEGSLGEF
jgi:ABC-2 type transport system permease protein